MRLLANKNVYDFVFFQGAWLVCVLLKNTWALLAILPFLIVHQRLSDNWRRDLKSGVTFAFVGALAESFMLGSGATSITPITNFFPPTWLMAMWFCFGIATHHSLAWLRKQPIMNPLYIALVGALLSPFAYLGAEKLGAITIATNGLWIVSLSWAVALPLVILMTSYSKGSAS